MLVLSLYRHGSGHHRLRFRLLPPADGTRVRGSRQILPQFILPVEFHQTGRQEFVFSWATITALMPAAFSMAMLGAIESLLCAVVLDRYDRQNITPQRRIAGSGTG